MPAFGKKDPDSDTLRNMYIEGELDWEAAPAVVVDYFPDQKRYTAAQIRTGVNAIRNDAKRIVDIMRNQGGKVDCCLLFPVLLLLFCFSHILLVFDAK
jgi:hypothetical protein